MLRKFIIETTETIITLVKIFKYSSFTINLKSLSVQKDRDCIILANGPSLLTDIENNSRLINDCDKIVVNDFSRSEYYEILKPNYYVIADPAFNNLNNHISLQNRINDTYEQLVKKTTWPIVLFFPYKISKFVRSLLSKNANIQIQEYNMLTIKGGKNFKYFCYKRNLGMVHAQNVLIASLFLMINLCYKTIYFVGADHSWFKNIELDSENRVCLADYHFYDKVPESIKLNPWLKNNVESFTMPEILRTLALMFDGYFELKDYSEFMNSDVYNLSKVSYIDAFPRKNI